MIVAVVELIQQHSSIFLHKFINAMLPSLSNDLFCLNTTIHNHEIRQLNKLRKPYFALTINQHFIKYSAVSFRNSLPLSITSLLTLPHLKSKLKKTTYLLSDQNHNMYLLEIYYMYHIRVTTNLMYSTL